MREGLYCNGVEIVLQEVAGLYCSIERKLYCNTADCIARLCSGWPGRKVYCNTVGWAGNCIATEKAGWGKNCIAKKKKIVL